MEKMLMTKVAIPGLMAAALCAGIIGCRMGETSQTETKNVASTTNDAPVASASVSTSETATVSAEAAVTTERIVSNVTQWLKSYQARVPFAVENDGKDVYIRGMVGLFPSLFSKYDIIIHLSAEHQEAYCYGYLPAKVPEEKRAAMVEVLFRADCAYGASPATLVLTADDTVRCQAWCPFSCLDASPEKAMPMLVGSVMEKLFACSQAVGRVILDAEGSYVANAVDFVKREAADNKADTEAVLKSCFSDSEYQLVADADDWVVKQFGGGDNSVGLIRSMLSDVKRDVGGEFDDLHYTLVVKDGIACSVCMFPVSIPKDKLLIVAEAATRLNQSLNCCLFTVDFESCRLWSRYSIPVSALTVGADSERINHNRLSVKVLAAMEIARNSEMFSLIVRGSGE